MTTREYKGFKITKRSGMDMKRRQVTGYRVMALNGLGGFQNFSSLKDAKAWVDAKVEA